MYPWLECIGCRPEVLEDMEMEPVFLEEGEQLVYELALKHHATLLELELKRKQLVQQQTKQEEV